MSPIGNPFEELNNDLVFYKRFHLCFEQTRLHLLVTSFFNIMLANCIVDSTN